jgi:predicted transcriptional regulator
MKTDQTKRDLSPEDREALERSAEDIRRGRFATDEEVKQLFDRYRPKGRP